MTSADIALHRLANQQIAETDFSTAEELVGWMGCIQAQDFTEAKWAIGCRCPSLTDARVEEDFKSGKIVRTHILRPAWHFILPSDIGWIRRLTAPRIKAFNKDLHRKLGIDDRVLRASRNVMTKALTGGRQLTRSQLLRLFKKSGIDTDDLRVNFLMMDAELEGLICSGGRRGKQFTYALLEEKVPRPEVPDREESLARLANRYFLSRGPATLQDFCWWSGLSLSDAKRGLEMNKSVLVFAVVNGQAYFFPPRTQIPSKKEGTIRLLPAFDEYTTAYKDWSDLLPPPLHRQYGTKLFKPLILMDQHIAGIWQRVANKDGLSIKPYFFTAPGETFPHASVSPRSLALAADHYGRFTGQPLIPFQDGRNAPSKPPQQ